MIASKYIPCIGLEVHVQLKTKSKLFCGCGTEFGMPPNTQVCPVCLGYPGAMPVINKEAVRLTVMAGLMVGSQINSWSKFDRKSYFYPDMPKNYQISQYDHPLCVGGEVAIPLPHDGEKKIRIIRIHLEEDVGKNMHFQNFSGIDFNRAGIPLMEIVSYPDINSPQEAYEYLLALKRILQYAEISDCNLEEGNVRCDVNCSVKKQGDPNFGVKTEIKNMNTFRGVFHALEFEIKRQINLLEEGGKVEQETRRWDPDRNITTPMRTKEDAHDYRYFPEPDLPIIEISRATIEEWRKALPESPAEKKKRFIKEFGIPDYDAGVLVSERYLADYFESTAKLSSNPKMASNFIMTEMLRLLTERNISIENVKITPQMLAELIKLVEKKIINSNTAKEIFVELFEKGGDPCAIVEQRGLSQISDASILDEIVDKVIRENPKTMEDIQKGKTAAKKFLMGQVMKISKGKADPLVVSAIIDRKIQMQK